MSDSKRYRRTRAAGLGAEARHASSIEFFKNALSMPLSYGPAASILWECTATNRPDVGRAGSGDVLGSGGMDRPNCNGWDALRLGFAGMPAATGDTHRHLGGATESGAAAPVCD